MKKHMQSILAVALVLVLAVSLAPSASAAVSEKLIGNPVPSGYLSPVDSSQQGKVVQEHYTVSSGSHANLEKYIYVYLPAEYESNPGKQYDIFYFMHGQGGTAYELLGEQFNGGQIKSMIDHMIADGKIKPIIIVAVTWNTNEGLSEPNSSTISSQGGDAERQAFHTEFENDVMPLIERKYRTYAGLATTASGASSVNAALKNSRNHRGFGGFSYGAHTTWYQLRSDVDYIYYFAPMSGGLSNLYNEIKSNRHDYELCCVTGTSDVTNGQCDTIMDMYSSDDAKKVNYYKINGATHSYEGYRQYLYQALSEFYAPKPFSDEAAQAVENGGYSYYVIDSTLKLKVTDADAAVIVAQYNKLGRMISVQIKAASGNDMTFDVELVGENYKIFSVSRGIFMPRCPVRIGENTNP